MLRHDLDQLIFNLQETSLLAIYLPTNEAHKTKVKTIDCSNKNERQVIKLLDTRVPKPIGQE